MKISPISTSLIVYVLCAALRLIIELAGLQLHPWLGIGVAVILILGPGFFAACCLLLWFRKVIDITDAALLSILMSGLLVALELSLLDIFNEITQSQFIVFAILIGAALGAGLAVSKAWRVSLEIQNLRLLTWIALLLPFVLAVMPSIFALMTTTFLWNWDYINHLGFMSKIIALHSSPEVNPHWIPAPYMGARVMYHGMHILFSWLSGLSLVDTLRFSSVWAGLLMAFTGVIVCLKLGTSLKTAILGSAVIVSLPSLGSIHSTLFGLPSTFGTIVLLIQIRFLIEEHSYLRRTVVFLSILALGLLDVVSIAFAATFAIIFSVIEQGIRKRSAKDFFVDLLLWAGASLLGLSWLWSRILVYGLPSTPEPTYGILLLPAADWKMLHFNYILVGLVLLTAVCILHFIVKDNWSNLSIATIIAMGIPLAILYINAMLWHFTIPILFVRFLQHVWALLAIATATALNSAPRTKLLISMIILFLFFAPAALMAATSSIVGNSSINLPESTLQMFKVAGTLAGGRLRIVVPPSEPYLILGYTLGNSTTTGAKPYGLVPYGQMAYPERLYEYAALIYDSSTSLNSKQAAADTLAMHNATIYVVPFEFYNAVLPLIDAKVLKVVWQSGGDMVCCYTATQSLP